MRQQGSPWRDRNLDAVVSGHEGSLESMLIFDIQTSRDTIGDSDLLQLIYVLVRISPSQQAGQKGLPLNLSLVVDRSTSMQGERLDTVKRAAALLLDHLGPQDVLSIISFSDRAEVVLPASHVHSKTPVISRIRALTADGGTEMYHGLSAGLRELLKAAPEDHLNHLILFTDGRTYGDEAACLKLANRAAERRIGVTGFGLGSEWNDQFLDALVSPSGGQSAYIEDPGQILHYLQARLNGLGSAFAQNVRLAVDEFPDEVKLKAGLKLKPYAQPLLTRGRSPLNLGALEGQGPLTYLLELTVSPDRGGRHLHIPLLHRADIPRQQVCDHTFVQGVTLAIASNVPAVSPPPELLEAVNVLNLTRMHEAAQVAVEQGDLDVATRRLRQLTTRLQEAGQSGLARQAELELERVLVMGQLSEDGRKRLKYGTRALFANPYRLGL